MVFSSLALKHSREMFVPLFQSQNKRIDTQIYKHKMQEFTLDVLVQRCFFFYILKTKAKSYLDMTYLRPYIDEMY
jgi:hypothetical protein